MHHDFSDVSWLLTWVVDGCSRQSVKAGSPEDRIKKYSISSHGSAGRSSLESISEDMVQRLIGEDLVT